MLSLKLRLSIYIKTVLYLQKDIYICTQEHSVKIANLEEWKITEDHHQDATVNHNISELMSNYAITHFSNKSELEVGLLSTAGFPWETDCIKRI